MITKNEALGILRKKNRESSASPEFWADIPDPRSELDQLLVWRHTGSLYSLWTGFPGRLSPSRFWAASHTGKLPNLCTSRRDCALEISRRRSQRFRLLWGDLAAFFLFWPLSLASVPSLFESPQPVRRVPPRLLRPLPWRFFPFFCFALPALLFLILFLPPSAYCPKNAEKSAVDAADKTDKIRERKTPSMKKRILPLLLILPLSLTACGNQKDTMSISVSGFQRKPRKSLDLFSDELMLFDYRTDDTVQSVSIDLWSCTDGEWASAGKVSGAMNGKSTRLGLRLNEYACDLYQTEGSGYTKSSYPCPRRFLGGTDSRFQPPDLPHPD